MNEKVVFLLGDVTAKGGIEKVTITLVEELKRLLGMNSSIVSLYKSGIKPSFSCDETRIEYLSNKHETSMFNRKLGLFSGLIFDLYYIIKKSIALVKTIKKNKASIVVCCDIKMVLLAYITSFFVQFKIVAVEHFEYDVPNSILKCLRTFLYKKISKVVILTSEDVDKYHWLPSDKLHIIPNIVSVKKDPLIEKEKVVLAVGRLCHQKGFDILINAWARSEARNSDWRLEIYGDGEDKAMLEGEIQSLELSNVLIKPFSSDIDKKYDMAQIFILSSRFEGLGMVLIEALAHSLPCISFDCPAGPKTIIKNNINGLLVPTGDEDKLSKSIDSLISSSEMRERFSKIAPSSISMFNSDSVTNKWLLLFRDM